MSSNRLIYDTCAYQKEMSKQCDQLTYILDPTKHYQEEPCRPSVNVNERQSHKMPMGGSRRYSTHA